MRAPAASAIIPATVLSVFRPFPALLLVTLTAGCGGRVVVDETAPFDTPRVDDCARRTPEAVPLGRIAPSSEGGANGFTLAADDGFVYFASEGRNWRVAKASGAPEPLTPPGSASDSRLVREGSSLFWSKDDEVFRAPASGGDPEYVGVSPDRWTISGQYLIASSGPEKGAALTRTPFGGGSSQEILPGDPEQAILNLAAAGDGVLVKRTADLLLVPTSDAPLQISDTWGMSASRPLEDGGFVYFGGHYGPPSLLRVAIDGGEPQILVQGFAIDTTIVGDTLYANVILRQPDDTFVGRLVRLPSSGGTFTAMATTDSSTPPASPGWEPPYAYKASGLAADASRVYFIQLCTDVAEYRLVSLPAYHVMPL